MNVCNISANDCYSVPCSYFLIREDKVSKITIFQSIIDDDDGGVLACVGSLEFLTRDFKRATDLLQKAQGTEIVDVKEFLTELVSLAEDFTQNTSHLLDKANLTLTRYENIGTYDTSPTSDCEAPDWDPGNRPSSLNDNQRQYLIKTRTLST